METLPTLTADRTHLFPGARLRLDGAGPTGATDVVVLFSDGVHAEGLLETAGHGLTLRVEEYRTGAGSRIEAKHWELTSTGEGSWRVAGPAS
ncbi:hypothetical protein GCM10022377_07930 [Zhihengliuella alba]|uniref:Uncharacterized protein n=1 Tax=Zhihengliuella alba TaxID=547018 RepID=A0ABP7CZP5_9MICC